VHQYNYSYYEPAGFFSGLWHGLISILSIIVRIFLDNIEMYAINNTGVPYDLGFLFGVAGSIVLSLFSLYLLFALMILFN
jgi:hypothetical protein